jgi:hypothetical protein
LKILTQKGNKCRITAVPTKIKRKGGGYFTTLQENKLKRVDVEGRSVDKAKLQHEVKHRGQRRFRKT